MVGSWSEMRFLSNVVWWSPDFQFLAYYAFLPSLILTLWSVQFSRSVVSDSLWPRGLQHARLPCLSPTCRTCSNSCPSVGDAIQPSHPLSSLFLPAFNISQHWGLFQWVTSSHQVAKVWEFQLQHQSFQWYSGLISFRIDWFNLLAAQGTLKSLLQCHSSKASLLQLSAFFIVQPLQPYMTTGKTIAWLDRSLLAK